MLYVKAKINDQIEIKVDLYEDETFTNCPSCGKEHQVEPAEIADILISGCDFAGTSIYCNGCISKIKAGDLIDYFHGPRSR